MQLAQLPKVPIKTLHKSHLLLVLQPAFEVSNFENYPKNNS